MNLFSCWALGDATRATGRSSAERLRLGSCASAFNNEAWDFLWEHMGKYVERVYSIWIYSMFDGKIYRTGMNIYWKHMKWIGIDWKMHKNFNLPLFWNCINCFIAWGVWFSASPLGLQWPNGKMLGPGISRSKPGDSAVRKLRKR